MVEVNNSVHIVAAVQGRIEDEGVPPGAARKRVAPCFPEDRVIAFQRIDGVALGGSYALVVSARACNVVVAYRQIEGVFEDW